MKRQLTRIIIIYFLLPLSFLLFSQAGPGEVQGSSGEKGIYVLEIKGVITAGTAVFIQRQLDTLDPQAVQAVVILMNTPGGLVDSTLELTEAFAAVPVPVIVLVAPSGAIAASAGAFILVSGDIAAMAPGTTVGAAMPVALSPGGAEPAEDKTVRFLAGHMRSLSEQKGRPGEITEKFVTENLTLTSGEALEEGVIDLLAPNLQGLLAELDGWEGEKAGVPYTLATVGAPLLEQEMNLQEQFQDKISDPQLAFLLLMVGGLGIYFGLGMPGTFVPETLGAIALLLGIYGIGLFDTNTMGIIFLVVGFALLVAEIFSAGFGVFGIGGAVSLLIGAFMLPQEPLMAEGWYPAFRATAIGVVLAVSLLSFMIVTVLVRSRRIWKEKTGSFFQAAETAKVVNELDPSGTVRMRGELWHAESESDEVIKEGTLVKVIRQEGLTLFVRPFNGQDERDRLFNNKNHE